MKELNFLDLKEVKIIVSKTKKQLLVILKNGDCVSIPTKLLQNKMNYITNSAIYEFNKDKKAS
jgi:hypothetical protein